MYEKLFNRTSAVARYREGPLSKARERFLEQCAIRGYSRAMLQKIAWVLLSVAPRININHGKLTTRDIEMAVDTLKLSRKSPENSQKALGSRQLFVHIAIEWMRSLDRFEPPDREEGPFEDQLTAFGKHLGDERGLSPVTISTRCERMGWFFKSLHPSQDSLRKILIVDVDAFIEAKVKQGWKRSSLAVMASGLRSFFRHAEGQGWCNPGIAAAIESPRIYAQEGLPEGPSWEDVQRLLASTCGNSPADIRDHAILMLLAIYGLRRGEVARLQLDHLDWVGDRIAVSRTKQRRTQWYLGHRTLNSTLSYTKIDLAGLRQVAELDLGRLL